MAVNNISQMEAYMIETLRNNGVADEAIITQVEKRDVSDWKELNPNFDFHALITLYEQNKEAFKSIILEGYKVKFLTLKGIQNLLKWKFHMVQNQHYTLSENGITDLQINQEQLAILKQILSTNWMIQEHDTESSSPLKKVSIGFKHHHS